MQIIKPGTAKTLLEQPTYLKNDWWSTLELPSIHQLSQNCLTFKRYIYHKNHYEVRLTSAHTQLNLNTEHTPP